MESKKAKITAEHRQEAILLRLIWDQKKPLAQAEFGEKYGIGNQAAVSNFLAGRSALSLKAAVGFAKGLDCEIGEFSPRLARIAEAIAEMQPYDAGGAVVVAGTKSAVPAGYVRLEHLSPRPSMGTGAALTEPIHIVQYLDVLESWVRQRIGCTDPARIKILTGNGRSMYPTIQHEDLVFVDTGRRAIEHAGIYVLDVADRLILKKALIQGNGTLIIRSDNTEEYPDEERYDLRHAGESITVCGEVLAWWTLRKG